MPNPIKIQATVVTHNQISEGVFLLSLLPVKKRFSFYPGQFLHLAIDAYDPNGGFWPESRVFSIASAPKNDTIEIVYSVKGVYTKRMMSEIELQQKVWLKFPYGDFIVNNYVNSPVSHVVIIAGGTGISPFLSYFRSKYNIEDRRTIHLYWGVKSPALFDMFPDRAALVRNPHTIHLYSETLDGEEDGNYSLGILPIEEIFYEQEKHEDCLYFLSGPPNMITDFKNYLLEKHVSKQNIIIDDWE